MFDRIRTLIHRLHEVTEADALTDRDLDDLGLSRDQFLAFLRMPQDITERVTAMAAIFRVPAQDLKRNYPQWLDVLNNCGHCSDRAACRTVLDKGHAARPTEATFCGNRAVFADLAQHAA